MFSIYIKRLFYKIKQLELLNKVDRFNGDGLNDDFQVSMLSKRELTTYFFATKDHLYLLVLVKFLVDLRFGENQSSPMPGV